MPAKNQHDIGDRAQAATGPSTRTEAARSAGLSEHEKKTALRVASVPASEFGRRVESAKPPSVTELAVLDRGADMAISSRR